MSDHSDRTWQHLQFLQLLVFSFWLLACECDKGIGIGKASSGKLVSSQRSQNSNQRPWVRADEASLSPFPTSAITLCPFLQSWLGTKLFCKSGSGSKTVKTPGRQSRFFIFIVHWPTLLLLCGLSWDKFSHRQAGWLDLDQKHCNVTFDWKDVYLIKSLGTSNPTGWRKSIYM